MSEIVTVRDLAMVTSDIQYAQRQGARQLASNLIEIGRLLVEAKTMVESKNWDKYIWDNFGYSTSSADNWMKLYREYGDNQEWEMGTDGGWRNDHCRVYLRPHL